jgi:hypothetical protein
VHLLALGAMADLAVSLMLVAAVLTLVARVVQVEVRECQAGAVGLET